MSGARSCPGCSKPMQAYFAREVELDRCLHCGGLWFDCGELEAVLKNHLSESPLEGITTRRCPVCRLTLSTSLLPGGVPAEVCTSCRGVYLDEGELEELAGGTVVLEPRDRDAWKALLPAPGPHDSGISFTCVRCGRQRPRNDANVLRSGLACRDCTPQPQTTEREKRAANEPGFDWLDELLDLPDDDA